MKDLKKRIINHIQAYNKGLRNDFLETKEIEYLLVLCHPDDREKFREEYKKLNKGQEEKND